MIEQASRTVRIDTPRSVHASIAVGIASAGRPSILRQTVEYIRQLEYPGLRIVICVPDIDDAAGLENTAGLEVVVSARGLTTQRNCLLKAAAPRSDILVFLDDDFLPAADFFVNVERAFSLHPDIVIATGHVVADGILTGGLTLPYAFDVLQAGYAPDRRVTDIYNAYGCNMAVRLAPVIRHDVTFDERLPLYGWLEDVDFSRNIARHGRSVMIWGARGVHLGVTSGRQSGVKLGYSQVANPVYLMQKKTMTPSRALAQIGRNILANIRGFAMRDSVTDRRGRLMGNLRALGDLLRGRSTPSRILEFDRPHSQDIPLSSPATRRR